MMNPVASLPEEYSYIIGSFTALWANSADDKLLIFNSFSQKIRFDISCKVSP